MASLAEIGKIKEQATNDLLAATRTISERLGIPDIDLTQAKTFQPEMREARLLERFAEWLGEIPEAIVRVQIGAHDEGAQAMKREIDGGEPVENPYTDDLPAEPEPDGNPNDIPPGNETTASSEVTPGDAGAIQPPDEPTGEPTASTEPDPASNPKEGVAAVPEPDTAQGTANGTTSAAATNDAPKPAPAPKQTAAQKKAAAKAAAEQGG